MRCKECGGLLTHLVTDNKGKCYYECGTGLTIRDIHGDNRGHIARCGKVYGEDGNPFSGHVIIKTGEIRQGVMASKVIKIG